jgi:thiamine-monophosphate kinase
LRRAGARPGDGIYVSGTVGDAGLGLRQALTPEQARLSPDAAAFVRARLDCPEPRLALGLALRGRATACLDVSDGLAQDLGHILGASGVGAELDLERLPLSPVLQSLPPEDAWRLALSSGDDYELCFTCPADRLPPDAGVPLTCIGRVTAEPGLRLRANGHDFRLDSPGYQHF